MGLRGRGTRSPGSGPAPEGVGPSEPSGSPQGRSHTFLSCTNSFIRSFIHSSLHRVTEPCNPSEHKKSCARGCCPRPGAFLALLLTSKAPGVGEALTSNSQDIGDDANAPGENTREEMRGQLSHRESTPSPRISQRPGVKGPQQARSLQPTLLAGCAGLCQVPASLCPRVSRLDT